MTESFVLLVLLWQKVGNRDVTINLYKQGLKNISSSQYLTEILKLMWSID